MLGSLYRLSADYYAMRALFEARMVREADSETAKRPHRLLAQRLRERSHEMRRKSRDADLLPSTRDC